MAYGDTWIENPALTGNTVSLCCSASGQHVFAAQSNGYLYYSSDYGLTWTQRFLLGVKDWRKIRCQADAGVLWAQLGAAQYLIKSTDLGLTWSAPVRNTMPQVWGLYVTPDGQGIMQSGSGAAGDAYLEMHLSNNGGSTWTSYRPLWGSIGSYSFCCAMSDNRQVIAVGTQGFIRYSVNNGSTWINRANNSGSTHNYGLIVSGDGTKLLSAASTDYLRRSANTGATWATVGNSLAYSMLSATATAQKILAFAGSALWISEDYGATWTQPLPQPGVTFQDVAQSSDGAYIYGGTSTKFYRNQGIPLTLTTVTPYNGTTAGGTTLTLRGTGFLAGTTVTIGGASVSKTLVSSTEMTIVTPAHAAGAVDIVLTNP